MKRALIIFLIFLISGLVVNAANEELKLRDYDGVEMPVGTLIQVINLRQFSTQTDDETTKVSFIAVNDTFMQEMNIIPSGTKFDGYIEKVNEPIVGTNASMIIRINKMTLPDGFEIPIKAYIYSTNNNKIGGGMTAPEKYRRHPHFQYGFGIGTLRYVPGPTRKMGEHLTIAAGAQMLVVLTSPTWITHTLTN